MTSPTRPGAATASSRRTVCFSLSVGMLVIYAAFIFLVAYRKELLGTQIVPGLSWGILFGVLVICTAWMVTLIYVLWANRNLDRPAARGDLPE